MSENYSTNMEYIPYGKHQIIQDDIDIVINTLKSPLITQGEIVPLFEKNISEKVKSKYSIAVNSATSALHLSCLALGVSQGDKVWTSPISFVASSNCALYCGAEIDFVDIDPRTGLIDTIKLKSKLEIAYENDNLPKVLIPVHLSGASCDMVEINKLSKKYGFSVIEDASHAIGGYFNSRPVGCCDYSSITVFSFHPVKIITSGEGGVATTNNIELAERLRILRSHGIVKNPDKFQMKFEGSWYYEQQLLGYNYRLTDIQAALGLSQLKRLEKIVIERNDQLSYYKKIFKSLPVEFLKIPNNVYSSVHLAVLLLPNNLTEKYFEIFEGMRANGIGVQLHYRPIYKNPFYQKFNFEESQYPGAEKYSKSAMSIPLFPGLTQNQQLKVKSIMEKLLK